MGFLLMAASLGVPHHAVESRVAALRRKHKARNRVHLALMLAAALVHNVRGNAHLTAAQEVEHEPK